MSRGILFATILLIGSCFKSLKPNENALLQQKSCVQAMESHDYDRAQVHCELCLEYDSAMPECLNGIGLIAWAKKDEAKAWAFFTRAIRENNDFTPPRNNLGVILFAQGNFAESLKYFNESLEIDPSNTDARYNKGLSLFRLAQRSRSSNDVNKSLALLLEARDQMTKLLALEPSFVAAYHDLGLIELNRFDLTTFVDRREPLLKSAQEVFEACLKIDEEYAPCHEGLAQVSMEQGHFGQATARYFSCLTREPNNSTCRKGIVDAFEKGNKAEGGYQKFKAEMQAAPQNAQAHYAFCAELFARGFAQEARQECEVALRLKSDICHAHFLLAQHARQILHAERASRYCHSFLACGGGKNALQDERHCREILAAQ